MFLLCQPPTHALCPRSATLKYVEQREKELGITPDAKLAEMGRIMNDTKHGDNIMVLVM